MKNVWNCLSLPEVDEDELVAICYKTRGRIRSILAKDYENVVKTSFSSAGIRKDALKAIFEHYLRNNSIADLKDEVNLIKCDDELTNICTFEELQSEIETLDRSLLYQMADDGIIYYSGGYTVGLSHPSDISTLSKLFDKSIPSKSLSTVEQLSMLGPNQSGMADVNENLVAKSLVSSSFDVNGFNKLRFINSYSVHLNNGITKLADNKTSYSDESFSSEERNKFGHLSKWFFKCRRAHLMKEVPDEGGSDLVAIFEINEDLKKGTLKWLVFRVKIKMGISQNTYTKNSKTGMNVIDRMKSYEVAFCKILKANSEEVQFVRVL
ncbi:hypothetical protein MP638_005380 [Amoeboaphelidium occidentale]|nr:hypothetical protein MP638_005380 [Amoeboaphelidium occidentale]